ncbi:RES family NAD+ phosphorylase, partial [Longimicrobium sp.]|uniref:RES family NAD+ phosphorylase n=1 Tax=Longimicrobium sp. TaxID=2029185 RepID=UPI002E2FD5EE
MITAWRICKTKHPPFDGTGARLVGARWNSPGRPMIYAADSFAGAILELLAHAARPRTLPGAHHAFRIDVPDDLVEVADPAAIPGWDRKESPVALSLGDTWLQQRRSAALVVPAIPSRPVGRNVLINPE